MLPSPSLPQQATGHRAVAAPDAPRPADPLATPAPPRDADAQELARLVMRAAAGDEHAWTTLVQRFGARVRGVARAQRLGAHDAEEVEQTTWLQLFTHIARVREPDKLGAYLHVTAQRASVRMAVAGRRETLVDYEPRGDEDAGADPLERLAGAQRRAALADAVNELPEHQRRLMEMLLADREPCYAEISEALDMPIGSIGPTRARCLERLRRNRRLVDAVAVGTL
jgi:RNA polymerase sigma factor (sigma-70 family)